MKKTTLCLLGLLTSFATFGQTDNPTNTRTVTVPSHPTQEIKTYTPQQEFDLAKLIPKDFNPTPTLSASTFSLADRTNPSLSAEGAAAIRFKDVPVNLATGAMSLPIPIYTLSEGLLSVPISLEYNGSGMKNQDVASSGANWNLNAGGMITRMVRGLPDEGLKSGSSNFRAYYKFGFGGDGTSVNNDTEPAIFYQYLHNKNYRLPKLKGEFENITETKKNIYVPYFKYVKEIFNKKINAIVPKHKKNSFGNIMLQL